MTVGRVLVTCIALGQWILNQGDIACDGVVGVISPVASAIGHMVDVVVSVVTGGGLWPMKSEATGYTRPVVNEAANRPSPRISLRYRRAAWNANVQLRDHYATASAPPFHPNISRGILAVNPGGCPSSCPAGLYSYAIRFIGPGYIGSSQVHNSGGRYPGFPLLSGNVLVTRCPVWIVIVNYADQATITV